MDKVDPATLVAYRDGELDPLGKARVERSLAGIAEYHNEAKPAVVAKRGRPVPKPKRRAKRARRKK